MDEINVTQALDNDIPMSIEDNTPEIIIEKKDGAKVVYDIKNNDISFNIDGDKIEKIR